MSGLREASCYFPISLFVFHLPGEGTCVYLKEETCTIARPPSGDCRRLNGPMKGASMQTPRPEILAFVSAAETVLSPALLISPLNDDERDIIQIYLKNLEDLVMQERRPHQPIDEPREHCKA